MSSTIINNITILPSLITTNVSKILDKITTTEMTIINDQTNNVNNNTIVSTDLFEIKKDIWTNVKNYVTNFYESDYFWPTTSFIGYGLITTTIIVGCFIYNRKINKNKKIWNEQQKKKQIQSSWKINLQQVDTIIMFFMPNFDLNSLDMIQFIRL